MEVTPRDLILRLVGELIADYPPDRVAVEDLWGAQYDAGLAWVQFPMGLGGLGIDARYQADADEELRAVGVPTNVFRNLMGVGMAAQTIVTWAERELSHRLLRPMFRCDEIWCQLFSEPGAGSDLASLSTSAVRDGESWVVNGQKVWTSLAHVSRWGLMLARTNPNVPKHKGLTYFLVDMTAPGVDVRPLRQATGEAEFNEVFFTDHRIPDAMRLGPEGDGWKVAVTTLMNERLALSKLTVLERGGGPIKLAVDLWKARADRDLALRDELMRLWIDTEVIRLTSMRARANLEMGEPGPESSTTKLGMTTNQHKIWELCLRLQGPSALIHGSYDLPAPTSLAADAWDEGTGDVPNLAHCYLTTIAGTIGGGTGNILRNVLGERVLGLPPEPRPDKDIAWSQLVR